MDASLYLRLVLAAALLMFLVGIYRNLISKVIQILQAQQLGEENAPKRATPVLQLIFNEVLLQYRIKQRSRILWARHIMIFGGFVTFFVLEFLIGITKGLPALAFMRPALKAGLDLSGYLLLAGLLIALVHWVLYRKEEQKLIDIKSLGVLFFIASSGLLSACCRTLLGPGSSFTSLPFMETALIQTAAGFSCPLEVMHCWLFLFHITIAAVFIAYLPYSKLIHIFAAPIGRAVTLDEGYVERKRTAVTESLL